MDIVKEHVAVFPTASVTLNVLVVTPTGNVLPLARPAICVVVGPEQLSVPTGAEYVATLLHIPIVLFSVWFDGQVICGNSVSLIVIVKEHVAVFPAASVTLNVLVVVPTGNVEPLDRPAVWVVVWPAQLTVPMGVV